MGSYLGQDDNLDVRGKSYQNNELGIDPATIATAGSALFKAGSSIFGGGGKDPNYSSKSLVDTIANFEEISTDEAQQIAQKMIKAAANGASDYELAQLLAPHSSNSYASGIPGTEKWSLVKGQLQSAVQQYRQSNQQQSNLPVNISASSGDIPAGVTYVGYAIGAAGLIGVGIYGYNEFIK